MDYFVRVMHGLGIITMATLTLAAGGDKGLQGLGAEPIPARAPRSPGLQCPWRPGSHGQMPNKHIPVLVRRASGTAKGLCFFRELLSVSEWEKPNKTQTDLEIKWGEDGKRWWLSFKAILSLNITADTGPLISLSLSLSIQTLNLMVVCLVFFNVQVLMCD